MKAVRTISRKYFVRQLVSIFMICCMFFNLPVVLANVGDGGTSVPVGSVSVTTGVNLNGAGFNDDVLVQMLTNKAVINWQDFDTDVSQLVKFFKETGNFAVLNRVIGGGATKYCGDLQAFNGSVFIVNTRGIVFGPSSFIQAQQIVASGIDITDRDFMNADGVFVFGKNNINPYGDQIGNVETLKGSKISAQDIALIGKNVTNKGTITAGSGGFVVMAAGEQVYLSKNGSNVVVEVSIGAGEPGDYVVDNGGYHGKGSGKISGANGGNVVLAAGDIFSTAITGVESLRAEAYGEATFNGDIKTSGDVAIYSSDSSTYLNEDVDAGGNLLLNNTTYAKGDIEAGGNITINGQLYFDGSYWIFGKDQDMKAGESIIANDSITKTTAGDLTLRACNDMLTESITVNCGGLMGYAGDKIVVNGDVYSKMNMSLTANTKGISNGDRDLWLYGTLNSDIGSICLDAKAGRGTYLFDDVSAGCDVHLKSYTWTNYYDGIKIEAGENVKAYDFLWGGGDLLINAGGNICFNDNVRVDGALSAYAGLDDSFWIFPGSGSITATGWINADSILLSAGAGYPGYEENMNNFIKVFGCLESWNGDISIGAYHDICIGGSVNSAGNLIINGDRHIGYFDHIRGGDVFVGGSIDAAGNIDILGNNIELRSDAYAGGNMTLTADTSPDFCKTSGPQGQLWAYGDLEAYGNIELYSSDNTTYLGGDVYAGGNVLLNNNTKLIGYDDQSIEAEGTLTANGFVRKVTHGDMWLMGWGANEDGKSVDLRYVSEDWTDPAASTCFGNLWIVGQNNVQISGDLSTFGNCERCYKPTFMDVAVPEFGNPYCRPTGGVAVVSYDGKVYTEDGINNDTLNISIYGSSDHWNGLGVSFGESDARAAIVVVSSDDLKFGDDSELRAFGKYYDDGSVDDRYAIDFVDTPGTRIPAPDGAVRDEGDPFDLAIYVASTDGDVHVGASTSIMSCEYFEEPLIENGYKTFSPYFSECILIPKGAMVVDAVTNVTFGQPFIDSLEIGDVGTRLELVSRVTEWLDDAIGRLPFADQFNLPLGYNYVLRGAGGFGEGAWVLENPVTPPLFEEAGQGAEEQEFGPGGCPALMQWFAQEVGMSEEDIQVYVANTFAMSTDIQPCDSCARLQNAAKTLDDNTRIAELARVINEFVTPAAPPTPEQMTLIAQAFADHVGDGTYYAAAGEYIDALVQYVGIMNSELGFAPDQATAFLTNNHAPATADAAVTAYIEARLAEYGG